jgi:thioesterase domain-containing protein
LADADSALMKHGGVVPLSVARGLELIDLAVGRAESVLVAMTVNVAALRQLNDGLPALLGGLVRGPMRRSVGAATVAVTDGDALRRRLSTESEAGQDRILLDLVLAQVVVVLKFGGSEVIEESRSLVEAGFDSLTAVELRNRLGSVTGLKLLPTLVFDYPMPIELAAYLRSELAITGAQGNAAETAAMRRVSSEADLSESIAGLFRTACATNQARVGFELLQNAALLRSSFGSAAEYGGDVSSSRMASGDAEAVLICFSSYAAVGGVHQHARFAAQFRGLYDLWVLPTPGFVQGEPLAKTVRALAQVLSEVVLTCAAGRQVILLGQSSGGVLAQAAAGYLEEIGSPVAAVVLVDTYQAGETDEVPDGGDTSSAGDPRDGLWDLMLQGMFDREEAFVRMDFARLTAMGWYFRLFDGWKASELSGPTLLVRASEPMVSADPDSPTAGLDWQANPGSAHTVVDVPGNHFTMMEEHVGTTGQVVRDWLETNVCRAHSSGNRQTEVIGALPV